ncbi:MAG: hypothetical protein AB7F74_20875 [Parvibaculaceae bacterium]
MSALRNTLAGTLSAVFFGILTAGAAVAACDPDDAIFADDFEFMDASWGDPDGSFFVENGALVVKGYRAQVNFSTQNEGANVCVDIKAAEVADTTSSPAGVIFWWKDWDNYYYFYSWNDGVVEARRVLKGKMSVIFSMTVPAMKTGVGQTNSFEIDLKPKDATLFVNGTQVKRFKGVQPKGGGVVGVTASSPDDKPARYEFDNFVVSAPAEEPAE